MADQRYPVFEGGQTLTRADLNLLRDFLDTQDSVLGRLIGFGVACGLTGTIAGGNLTIERGLAIDQLGRPLLLDAAVRARGDVAGTQAFDFVDPAPGGTTPVLVFEEVDEPAPECDDAGCDAHAATRIRRASIVYAAGRLRAGGTDFQVEPLLDLAPLTVSTGSVVHGSFVGNRDAILNRLAAAGVLLSPAGRTRLAGLVLKTTDLPAVRIYKAAFLNQVLFAAIELMRCRSLHAASCLRTAARPGVALGWLRVVAGVPTWDCRYRHAFQPPVGLSMALLGGGCADPCDLFLDRLEALLSSYSEPVVPAPSDPPKDPPRPGDFDLCPKWKTARTGIRGKTLATKDCLQIFVPPDRIPDRWQDVFKIPDDIVTFDPGYVDPVDPWVLYDSDDPDFAKAGAMSLLPAFGARADGTKQVIDDLVREHGIEPDVRVVTQTQAARIPGYSPQTTVSLGDTMLLVTDDTGKVVTTGRVSNQQHLKNVGPAVNRATAASVEAVGAAAEAGAQATAAAASLAGLKGTIDELRTGIDDVRVGRDTLQSRLVELNDRLRATELRQDAIGGDLVRTSQRIDAIYTSRPVAPRNAVEVDSTMVNLFTSISEAIEKSATARQLPAVRQSLKKTQGSLSAMREKAETGTPLMDAERQTLVLAMEGLVDATERAGAPRTAVTQLRQEVGRLRERFGG